MDKGLGAMGQKIPNGRNKRIIKIGTQVGVVESKDSLSSIKKNTQTTLPKQLTNDMMMDRIQQKLAITKNQMDQYFIPELERKYSDAQLEAELNRISKDYKAKVKKNQHRQ